MNLHELPWRRWLSIVIPVGALLLLIAILVPAIRDARDQARKTESKNNLRQLGLALQNYHDAHESLPPGAVVREDAVAMQGWYTQILAYVDCNPYYNMIQLDRPWDDYENNYIFRLSIPVCLIPGVDEICTDNGYGLMHYMGNPNVLHRNSHVTFEEMTAGTANTWLAGEVAGNYQPWGYPFDWRSLGMRLNNGPNGYGRPTGDGAYLLMADGSARFLVNDIEAEVLTRLADAPPIADRDKTAIPSRRFVYSTSVWERIGIDLDHRPDEGLFAEAWLDDSGTPYSVLIRSRSKFSGRTASTTDLRKVVNAYPEMRELVGRTMIGPAAIDDEAAEVLSVLKRLEVLHVNSIKVSERGLQFLRRLPNLKVICLESASRKEREHLATALPECDIRVHRLDH